MPSWFIHIVNKLSTINPQYLWVIKELLHVLYVAALFGFVGDQFLLIYSYKCLCVHFTIGAIFYDTNTDVSEIWV